MCMGDEVGGGTGSGKGETTGPAPETVTIEVNMAEFVTIATGLALSASLGGDGAAAVVMERLRDEYAIPLRDKYGADALQEVTDRQDEELVAKGEKLIEEVRKEREEREPSEAEKVAAL